MLLMWHSEDISWNHYQLTHRFQINPFLGICIFFVCLFVCCFLGPQMWHMEVPRLGVELELSCQPMPQSQPRRIWAMSVTYTTAHGHPRSLTNWARPGIEPASSWILVGFITSELQRKFQKYVYKYFSILKRYASVNTEKRTFNLKGQ